MIASTSSEVRPVRHRAEGAEGAEGTVPICHDHLTQLLRRFTVSYGCCYNLLLIRVHVELTCSFLLQQPELLA